MMKKFLSFLFCHEKHLKIGQRQHLVIRNVNCSKAVSRPPNNPSHSNTAAINSSSERCAAMTLTWVMRAKSWPEPHSYSADSFIMLYFYVKIKLPNSRQVKRIRRPKKKKTKLVAMKAAFLQVIHIVHAKVPNEAPAWSLSLLDYVLWMTLNYHHIRL